MKKSSKKVAPATPAGAAGVGGNVRPAAPTSSTDRDNTSLETLTEDMIHDLEMAFRLFDEDGSGSISINELEHVFESMGQKPTKEEISAMMSEVDADKSGSIDLTEFCQLMVMRMQDPDDPKLMREAFKIFDKDGSGEITRGELKEAITGVMSKTQDSLADDELNDMLNEFDTDGDGTISYDEFVHYMCSSQN